MRKVILAMDQNEKYETIKTLVDTNSNKKRAYASRSNNKTDQLPHPTLSERR